MLDERQEDRAVLASRLGQGLGLGLRHTGERGLGDSQEHGDEGEEDDRREDRPVHAGGGRGQHAGTWRDATRQHNPTCWWLRMRRSEDRRGGTERVSTCRAPWWSSYT